MYRLFLGRYGLEFFLQFKEISLRMIANRTFFRRFRAFYAMAAVGAFPNNFGRAFKDFAFAQRVQQSLISFFVAFFNFADRFKQESDFVKTFFSGFFGHAGIHVGPFIVFAGSSVFKVLDS